MKGDRSVAPELFLLELFQDRGDICFPSVFGPGLVKDSREWPWCDMSPLIPSWSLDLCMSWSLQCSLTSSSSTKGESSLLQTFPWFLGFPASFSPRPSWFPPLSFVTWVLRKAFLVFGILGFSSSWVLAFLSSSLHAGSLPMFLLGYLSLLPPSICLLSAFVFGAPGSSTLPCWHFFPGLGCLLGWSVLELGRGDL